MTALLHWRPEDLPIPDDLDPLLRQTLLMLRPMVMSRVHEGRWRAAEIRNAERFGSTSEIVQLAFDLDAHVRDKYGCTASPNGRAGVSVVCPGEFGWRHAHVYALVDARRYLRFLDDGYEWTPEEFDAHGGAPDLKRRASGERDDEADDTPRRPRSGVDYAALRSGEGRDT